MDQRDKEVEKLLAGCEARKDIEDELETFIKEVYPAFQSHGFTLAEAFNATLINDMTADVQDLIELIREKF
jgi:hypothetical protein